MLRTAPDSFASGMGLLVVSLDDPGGLAVAFGALGAPGGIGVLGGFL